MDYSHSPLSNDDFFFLLKATCYHYLQLQEGVNDTGVEGYNQRARDIKSISLGQAFTICCPGLVLMDMEKDSGRVEGILEGILSVDEQQEFLLDEKNAEGQYPIHRMIMNYSYFFMETVRAEKREGLCHYLIGVILGAVPQCSHQLDKDGRLPLHLASDPTTLHVLKKNTRYELVYDIWKAYPEAASVLLIH